MVDGISADHLTISAKNVQPGRTLAVALILTLGYSVVEALAGWWAGSLALLSDAGHMLGDAASLGIAAFAAWAARRAPSARHSYGFGRAEIVAGFVNAAFMARGARGEQEEQAHQPVVNPLVQRQFEPGAAACRKPDRLLCESMNGIGTEDHGERERDDGRRDRGALAFASLTCGRPAKPGRMSV